MSPFLHVEGSRTRLGAVVVGRCCSGWCILVSTVAFHLRVGSCPFFKAFLLLLLSYHLHISCYTVTVLPAEGEVLLEELRSWRMRTLICAAFSRRSLYKKSWRRRTWICAAWSGRSPSEAQKLTNAHLNLCFLKGEKSSWSSEVDAYTPESVLSGEGEVVLTLRSRCMRTWICAALRERSPSEAHKMTHAHLNLCCLEWEKSFWSSQVEACAPESVLPGVEDVLLKLRSRHICTWICAPWSGRCPSEAQKLTHAHLNLCFLQCCGTGTGTGAVGTVTFWLVEPEP
jgi:hypothetical protein